MRLFKVAAIIIFSSFKIKAKRLWNQEGFFERNQQKQQLSYQPIVYYGPVQPEQCSPNLKFTIQLDHCFD